LEKKKLKHTLFVAWQLPFPFQFISAMMQTITETHIYHREVKKWRESVGDR
jgi:hypothetical protein